MQRFKVKQLIIDLPRPGQEPVPPGPDPDPGCNLLTGICLTRSCPPCPPPEGCEGMQSVCQEFGLISTPTDPPTVCPSPPSWCDDDRISPLVDVHLKEFGETQDLDLLRRHLRELEAKYEPQTIEEIELVQTSLRAAQRTLNARKRGLLKTQKPG